MKRIAVTMSVLGTILFGATEQADAAKVVWHKAIFVPVAVTIELESSEVDDLSKGIASAGGLVRDPVAAAVLGAAAGGLKLIDRGRGVNITKGLIGPAIALPAIVTPR